MTRRKLDLASLLLSEDASLLPFAWQSVSDIISKSEGPEVDQNAASLDNILATAQQISALYEDFDAGGFEVLAVGNERIGRFRATRLFKPIIRRTYRFHPLRVEMNRDDTHARERTPGLAPTVTAMTAATGCDWSPVRNRLLMSMEIHSTYAIDLA